jgi:molybdate transport system substrate-binding protein
MIRRLVAALSFFAVSCSGADELHVFAAASLTNVLEEIAATYTRESDDVILFNFGASSTLARQIASGAPADLFLSADERQMNGLASRGLVVESTRTSMLSNELAVVVSTGGGADIRSAGDLERLSSIALADPSHVPAGIYARQWLTRAGLWDSLAKRIIPTDNVRGALAAVEGGNADAAIVYRTDALASRRVRIAFDVPHDAASEISYPFAVVAGSAHPEAARRFLAYLQSPPARAIFSRHGFIVRSGS